MTNKESSLFLILITKYWAYYFRWAIVHEIASNRASEDKCKTKKRNRLTSGKFFSNDRRAVGFGRSQLRSKDAIIKGKVIWVSRGVHMVGWFGSGLDQGWELLRLRTILGNMSLSPQNSLVESLTHRLKSCKALGSLPRDLIPSAFQLFIPILITKS